jgi:hypothetical protein
MGPSTISRLAWFVLLIATIALGADTTPPTYRHGTITKNFSASHKSYDLKGPAGTYQINNCGDFQTGQAVDYRETDGKIYIHRGRWQRAQMQHRREIGSHQC